MGTFDQSVEERKQWILDYVDRHPGCTLKQIYSLYGSFNHYHNGDTGKQALDELGIKEIRRYKEAVHVEVTHVNGGIYALLLDYHDLEKELDSLP